jgi:hypothetical protein
MTTETATSSPAIIGACRGCGYALQGLSSNRCPECGRTFDPNDPKTMHIGRRAGRIGLLLGRPIRWTWVLAVLFLATSGIVATTRLQLGSWKEWDLAPADLKLYMDWASRRPKMLVTWIDQLYVACMWLWVLVAAWIVLRSLVGIAARRWYRIVAAPAVHRTRIFFVAMLLLLISNLGVLIGWPYRLGQHNAADFLQEHQRLKTKMPTSSLVAVYPWGVTEPQRQQRVMWSAMRQAPRPEQRLAGLAMLYRTGAASSVAAFVKDAIAFEDDPTVLEWEIRVLGMTHDRDLLDIADRFLQSPDQRLRVAALDAITASADPWFDSMTELMGDDLLMNAPAPIPIRRKEYRSPAPWDPPQRVQYAVPTEARVANIATTTPDPREREAAAWALRSLQQTMSNSAADSVPGFRVAEWGVWVDTGGGLQSANQVLGDIPAFVHQYGDTAANLAAAKSPVPWVVTKPVMHFYANRPIVVSLDVLIRRGRVQYVFPKADDYSTDFNFLATQNMGGTTQPLSPFDAAGKVPPFADRHSNPLSWIVEDPMLTTLKISGPGGFAPAATLMSLGFHYDTLLITPQQPSLQPPNVPADSKYAWWSKLRQVPSAWVSSRGEAERFLYYDGPTLQAPRFRIRLKDPQHLAIEATKILTDSPHDRTDSAASASIGGMRQTARADHRRLRSGMYIDIGKEKHGELVTLPTTKDVENNEARQIGTSPQLSGEQLEAKFREWLTDAGLTAAESDGMLTCWREQFFQKPGRRFVMLMSAADYDSLCPLEILPRPQTLARVGLVWTELQEQKSEVPQN